MKITATAAILATAATAGIIGAPIASADDVTTSTIGSQSKLTDGNVVQGWTISGLRPSADVIPYPVAGTLWEATATDEAIQGSATPIISNLNARTGSGQTYRVLFGVATPQGVNPATIGQGEKTTGKVYFDVTGDAPDSVVYSTGDQDLLVWAQPASTPRQAGVQWSPPARGAGSPAPAAPPVTPPPAGAPGVTPAAATPAGTPLSPPPGGPPPAGSQGTPLPGSQGTPLPTGSQGTPLPTGSQGTPLPAGSPSTPQPAGSPTPSAAPITSAPPGPAT